MFEKLVSNLPFTPSLIGDVAFYASRLRSEETTRRLGVFFIISALIMQSLAVFRPPQSANAANDSDLIRGGISSKEDMLKQYRSSHSDIANILTYAGITEAELQATKVGSINSLQHGRGSEAWKSWGRISKFSSSTGEVKHVIPFGDKTTTVYSRPLWRFDSTSYTKNNGSSYKALVGHSKTRGNFAIIFNCGNLVTQDLPTPRLLNSLRASCDAITGMAIDERDKSQPVTVYLYFGGPPGKGKRSSAIATNPINGNFTYPVDPTKDAGQRVWAVMKPLPGYPEASVGFKDTVTISQDCAPKPLSVACTSLKTIITATSITAVTSYKTSGDGTVDKAIITISGGTSLTQTFTRPASPIRYSFPVKSNTQYQIDVAFYSSGKVIPASGCNKSVVTQPGVCPYNPALPANDPVCKPCPADESLWINDNECKASILFAKVATNTTQGRDATAAAALPGDKIAFTITAENTGATSDTITIEDDVHDLLEYATLDNTNDAILTGGTLRWTDIDVAGKSTAHRTFTATIKTIPPTASGTSEPSSFDCVINNSIGISTIEIPLSCPDAKKVEGAMRDLPATGPAENMLALGGVSTVATYLFAYTRQKRRDLNRVRRAFDRGEL